MIHSGSSTKLIQAILYGESALCKYMSNRDGVDGLATEHQVNVPSLEIAICIAGL